MVTIPTYQRQRGIPATTGVSAPPVVLINNPVAKSVLQFSQVMGGIGDNLLDAERKSHVSASVVNATLKLRRLENESKKLRGSDALLQFHDAAQGIYDEASSGLVGPGELGPFNNKWQILVANSEIAIRSDATKRAYSELAGDLETGLDSLVGGLFYDEGGAEVEVNGQIAISTGTGMIDIAIATGVIDPKAGAVRKLKFIQDVAEESVLGWMNAPGQELIAVYDQMGKGKFVDSSIQNMWKILDEKTKARLKSTTLTNMSRSLALEAKVDAQDARDLTIKANRDIMEFLQPETTEVKRRELLKDLADNASISPATYSSLYAALVGKTTQFDNDDDILSLRIRIVNTPEAVTQKEILEAGYSTPVTKSLLEELAAATDKDFDVAIQMLRHHDVFVPKDLADQFFNTQGMNAAQAKIWTIVLKESQERRKAGDTYDVTDRVIELIAEFEKDGRVQGESLVTAPVVEIPEPDADANPTLDTILENLTEDQVKQLSARSQLRDMGILSREDHNVDWGKANIHLGVPEQLRILDLVNVAFP